MMRPPLKAVFFDAAGTLIYLPRPVGEHYREIALRHGIDLPADMLEREFRQGWKTAPPRENTKGPRPDDDREWWRTLVRRVLDRALPTTARHGFAHEAFFEELYAHFEQPGVWAAYPETELVLRSLRTRGIEIGLISNFDRRLYRVLDHLGLTSFFTAITISSEVGADKPDPAIFQRALTALGVRAEEAVHVGDDPNRDRGAEAVGLDVFELDRPARTPTDLFAWLEARESGQNELASTRDVP